MADSAYKVLDENDRVTTRTLLHEAIPVTGTIVSGTYGTFPDEDNIKNFSHGMFQSVYDYPFLSSSANHIFDITVGVSTQSGLYLTTNTQYKKKKNIYNQMAQVLVGYDKTGSVLQFDADGDFVAGGRKINDAIFFNFSRLLTKDEIKKESFEMVVGVDDVFAGTDQVFAKQLRIFDMSASNEYRVNSPAGEYGILYAQTQGFNGANSILNTDYTGFVQATDTIPCGLIYYQAGVAVLTSSLFLKDDGSAANFGISNETTAIEMDRASGTPFDTMLKSSEISSSADAIRHRIQNISFNNTTELNSTIYFCRANHNEFNYSSNPTYLNGSKIRVKSETTDVPVSYITTIGLYNDRRELLAVAKLSEPLKKTPDTEFTLRVRLDY